MILTHTLALISLLLAIGLGIALSDKRRLERENTHLIFQAQIKNQIIETHFVLMEDMARELFKKNKKNKKK